MKEKYYTEDEYTKDLIQEIVEKIISDQASKYILAIIVTGSFGRNEPMYERNPEGSLYLRSDIEIGLVYSNYYHVKDIYQLIDRVEKDTPEALELLLFQERRMRCVQNYNYSVGVPKKKTLFTYDVFNSAYTVWGKDYLKESEVCLNEVDMYEAKKIVANRIAEYCCFMHRGLDVSLEDYQVQWKAKILIAIGTAWLICIGKYKSSYADQYKIIASLKREAMDLFEGDFWEDYSNAYQYLRKGGSIYNISDVHLRHYAKKINMVFNEMHLTKSRCKSLSKNIRMWKRFLSHGLKYGIGFEDKIYQLIIDYYIDDNPAIQRLSKDWFNILY